MNTPNPTGSTKGPLDNDNIFLNPPKEDAITASERKRKELEADCAKMRDNTVERKAGPPDRFELATSARNLWRFILPEGDTLEDALETDYWVHILPRLNVLDQIEVNPDDGSFYAVLQVRSLAFGQAATAVINFVNFDEAQISPAPSIASEYLIEFKGPYEKWVVKSSNGETLVSKLDTRPAAAGWLSDHLKAQRS